MRIGILGGTFNPIHNGHLLMAEYVREAMELEQVWIMPSGRPPHKHHPVLVTDEARCEMIKLAIQGNEAFVFSDMEMTRQGTTYTADTLEQLKKTYPEHEFYFIMGADSFVELSTWYQPEKIFSLAEIVVVNRQGTTRHQFKEYRDLYERKYGKEVSLVEMPFIGISSTNIRLRAATGLSVRYQVPDAVAEYMEKKGMYQVEEKTERF